MEQATQVVQVLAVEGLVQTEVATHLVEHLLTGVGALSGHCGQCGVPGGHVQRDEAERGRSPQHADPGDQPQPDPLGDGDRRRLPAGHFDNQA